MKSFRIASEAALRLSKQVYGMEINRVYQMYSSEQLASMATIRMTQK